MKKTDTSVQKNDNLSTTKNQKSSKIEKLLKFTISVFVTFAAVWLFSGERGAWQGVPFILFAPAIANALYPNRAVNYAVFALSAFFVSEAESVDLVFSFKYTAVVVLIAVISIFVKRLAITAFKIKRCKGAVFLAAAAIITVASFAAYFNYNGTYFGNLNAAEENKLAFLEKYEGNGIDFTPGNTFYSHSAGGYLTEFSFSHGNNITALYGKNTRNGETDGYHNYCAALMMNAKADDLAYILSYSHSRNIEYAVRYKNFSGTEKLLPWSNQDDFSEKMNFEIAFYERTDSPELFARLCREYYDKISESDFTYESITFLGVNGYTYQLTVYPEKREEIKLENVEKFDKSSFKVYKSDEDVKDYWK